MKKFIFAAVGLAALAAGLTACNEEEKLAKDVAGAWSTDQQTLFNNAQGQATGGDVFTFEVDPKTKKGGIVNVATNISLSRASDALTPANQPFSVSVAALASVSGRWEAIDDDEIRIDFDANTLKVTVDPEAVALVANPLSGTSQAEVDSLRPQMAQFYQTELMNTMSARYSSFSKLDDVKLRNSGKTLKFEASDIDYILQRR
ncbi:MAG: hypothetical protein HDR89_00730 [Bacteroides sp.]|nr:hypothetical protein [Bacteroides sp.]MBD5297878.1 hypothetical protein [Bacteroides sp.]MBD5319651.1 hypothetical protein [Bacteroides sp.]MBD5349395.1 hypothetical protein [Bacteroides sp.]MDE6050349.1 hypothetical protein [Paramuribaculum sp.]